MLYQSLHAIPLRDVEPVTFGPWWFCSDFFISGRCSFVPGMGIGTWVVTLSSASHRTQFYWIEPGFKGSRIADPGLAVTHLFPNLSCSDVTYHIPRLNVWKNQLLRLALAAHIWIFCPRWAPSSLGQSWCRSFHVTSSWDQAFLLLRRAVYICSGEMGCFPFSSSTG